MLRWHKQLSNEVSESAEKVAAIDNLLTSECCVVETKGLWTRFGLECGVCARKCSSWRKADVKKHFLTHAKSLQKPQRDVVGGCCCSVPLSFSVACPTMPLDLTAVCCAAASSSASTPGRGYPWRGTAVR